MFLLLRHLVINLGVAVQSLGGTFQSLGWVKVTGMLLSHAQSPEEGTLGP